MVDYGNDKNYRIGMHAISRRLWIHGRIVNLDASGIPAMAIYAGTNENYEKNYCQKYKFIMEGLHDDEHTTHVRKIVRKS